MSRFLNNEEIEALLVENTADSRKRVWLNYDPMIARYAGIYSRLFNKEYADLVQEGYVGLGNAIKTYKTGRPLVNFRSYAEDAIKHNMIQYCTRRKSAPLVGHCEYNDSEGFEFELPLVISLGKPLTEREALVIRKLYWEDKGLSELAKELGVSRQAINLCEKRALKKLKAKLSYTEED